MYIRYYFIYIDDISLVKLVICGDFRFEVGFFDFIICVINYNVILVFSFINNYN